MQREGQRLWWNVFPGWGGGGGWGWGGGGGGWWFQWHRNSIPTRVFLTEFCHPWYVCWSFFMFWIKSEHKRPSRIETRCSLRLLVNVHVSPLPDLRIFITSPKEVSTILLVSECINWTWLILEGFTNFIEGKVENVIKINVTYKEIYKKERPVSAFYALELTLHRIWKYDHSHAVMSPIYWNISQCIFF